MKHYAQSSSTDMGQNNSVGALTSINCSWPKESWSDWRWQLRSSVRSIPDLIAAYPALSLAMREAAVFNSKTRRMMITPYALSLIKVDECGVPCRDDPLWRQLSLASSTLQDGDDFGESWIASRDIITKNLEHKYPNRVLLRITDTCHSYCQYCYMALRTLATNSSAKTLDRTELEEVLSYIRSNPEIEEVVISGGDPLFLSDDQLGRYLSALRSTRSDLILRLNTRALSHNPFRITDNLVEVLRAYRVGAIGLHVTHPNELSVEFCQAIAKLRSVVPMLISNIPLLRGVNDSLDTMKSLCMGLYRQGVAAGYLIHFAPRAPARADFATSISCGIDLIRGLRRHISAPAVPEFVLMHPDGKITVPIDDKFEILTAQGSEAVQCVNWKGNLVTYPS